MKFIFLTFSLSAFLIWQTKEASIITNEILTVAPEISPTRENIPPTAPGIADFVVRSRDEKPLYRKGHTGVGIRYIICTQGIFPYASGNPGSPGPFVGEIRIFAPLSINSIPAGWMACEGQLLTINPYQMLFALIGTEYGGDGRTNFALPDLRGATVVGPGQGWTATEKSY